MKYYGSSAWHSFLIYQASLNPQRHIHKRCRSFTMRHFLTILFIELSIGCLAQDLVATRKKLDLINVTHEFRPDSSGLHLLRNFEYHCTENIMNDEHVEANYLHVLDLNHDGEDDILFSGPCNPYPQVGIFLNRGDHFDNVYSRGGEIVAIEKGADEVKIYALFRVCCAGDENWLEEITVGRKSVLISHTVNFNESTKLNLDCKLKLVKLKGILRTTPTKNDSIMKDPGTDREIFGNRILELKKPERVIQLHTQGEWALVMVRKSSSTSVIGWLSLRK